MSNEINDLVGFESFVVDKKKKILWHKDEAIKLPLKAVEVLCVLLTSPGRVFSKEELLDAVWKDSFVEEGVLPQNVYRLRKAFKSYGNEEKLIETIPSRGYRFTGTVREILEERTLEESRNPDPTSSDESNGSIEKRSESQSNLNAKPSDNRTKSLPDQSVSNRSNGRFYGLGVGVILLAVLAGGAWYWYEGIKQEKSASPISDKFEITRLTESGKAYFPAISRDNQHLAYILNEKNKYSLILQHIPTKSETVVIEPQEYSIRSLNFSEDGNHLFYITREPTSRESTIHRIPIYGGSRQSLVTNVRDLFSLSPDGKQFAFFRQNSVKRRTELLVSDVDGKNEKVVASRKYPNYFKVWDVYPGWSPDGKRLVTSAYVSPSKDRSRNNNFLVEYEIATGKERILRSEEWKIPYQAYYLKNGKGLVVLATDQLHKQLWYMSYEDAEVSRITNDTNNYEYFKLSFDSDSIITTIEVRSSNLFTISADGKNATQITEQNAATFGHYGLDWTQDGKQLVYVKSESRLVGDLWKIDIETKEKKQITFNKEFKNRFPNTTMDGNSVVFASTRQGNSQIWQIDLDGQNLKQLTTRKIGANNPELSRDGNTLFYTTPAVGASKFWQAPLSGGKYKRILGATGGQNRVSPVNPDQIISYHFERSAKESPWKYLMLSLEGNAEPFKLNFDAENHAYEWSKDGLGVYFPFKSKNQNNLWYLSVAENKARQLTDFTDQKITNLSVSPDGRTIAISRGSSTSNIVRISNVLR